MCSNSQGYHGSNNLLSPAAQAVLDAWAASENGVYLLDDPERLAAALRAAVEQVLPLNPPDQLPPAGDSKSGHYVHGWVHSQLNARIDLLAIAAELEGRGDG